MAVQETVAVLALIAVIGAAVAGSRKLPEAAIAVPLAGLLVLLRVVRPQAALDEIGRLGPTVGFLAAVLLLAHLCDEEGVFTAAGTLLARGSRGQPVRLLGLVFLVASGVTALLSLDATVVLFTPVVFATATALQVRAKPHVYACTHLANSASLLLPVSNLTNLLAFAASGLGFVRFAGLMLLPWLVVIGVEYGVFRWFFAAELRGTPGRVAREPAGIPAFALVVLALTLLAFGVTSLIRLEPVWPAAAGAAVLAVRRLARRQSTPRRLLAETNPLFCIFVLALGVVVAGVSAHGLGRVIHDVLPSSAGLPELLLTAAAAALLANLVNNLPAVLLLLPALHSPGLILAALLGVNIGPNLTYVGSLATLLWRRVLRGRGAAPRIGEFFRLGAIAVPCGLVGAVLALWVALRTIGL
ncbi:MAG TPA: SLC13 family permease [Mycobacteriales bacterium]|jgi:arsenical pump membrane protein|nr:SLC13 family permease [Mycobacteriales bacterium]